MKIRYFKEYLRMFLLMRLCPKRMRCALILVIAAHYRFEFENDSADLFQTLAEKIRPKNVGSIVVFLECAIDPMHQGIAAAGTSTSRIERNSRNG